MSLCLPVTRQALILLQQHTGLWNEREKSVLVLKDLKTSE